MIGNIHFLAVAALIGIALYIIMTQRNLIKLTMGVSILASAVNLFLIALGFRPVGTVLITVVILALMLTLIMRIYRHTGSIDSKESRLMKE